MAKVSKREWTAPNGAVKSAWVVRWTDGGKHKSKQFSKKKTADSHRLAVEVASPADAVLEKRGQCTVETAANEFLKHQEDRLSDGRIGKNRIRSLTNDVNLYVIPILGGRHLNELRGPDVEAFYAEMRRKHDLSPRSAKDRVYTFSLIEDFARRRQWTSQHSAREALKELRGVSKSIVSTFTEGQIKMLLDTIESKGPNLKRRSAAMVQCFVHLATFCGLRFGEIVALKANSVDYVGRVILVRESLLFDDTLKGPKTRAGVRDVPFPPHLADVLLAWQAQWYVRNDRGLLFRTQTGGPISNENFHRQWRDVLKRAGLYDETDVFHFHALRHFASSWMIENGMSVMDVAALLGHAKYDTTLQVYAHSIRRQGEREKRIDTMSALLRCAPIAHETLSP